MNLRRPGKSADYVDTGSWASKAIREAKILGSRQRGLERQKR